MTRETRLTIPDSLVLAVVLTAMMLCVAELDFRFQAEGVRPAGWIWIPSGMLLLLAGLFTWKQGSSDRRQLAVFAALLTGVGMIWHCSGDQLSKGTALQLDHDPEVSSLWTCLSDPEIRFGRQSVVLASGRLKVLASLPAEPGLRYGDRLELTLRLRPFDAPQNPGEFDAPRFYQKKGILARAQIAGIPQFPQPLAPLSHTIPQRQAYRFRGLVTGLLTTLYGEETGGLAAAMSLGDERYLATEIESDFRIAGLSHVLVVSGSNVALIAALGPQTGEKLGLSYRRRHLLTALLLLIFGSLTGWDASCLRAVFMYGWRLVARQLKRPANNLNLLGLATLSALFMTPRSALSLGYLMSGAVSGGILLGQAWLSMQMERRKVSSFAAPEGSPEERSLMRRQKCVSILHVILSVLTASVAAQLAVLPFLCWIDGAVSSGSLPLNLMAAPLASVIPLLSLLLLLLLPFPQLETLFLPLSSGLGSALVLLQDMAGLPASRAWPQYLLCKKDLLLAAFLLWVMWLIRRLHFSGFRPAALLYASLIIGLVVLLRLLPLTAVTFIAVGQGDATLIMNLQGSTVLIDTGPPGAEQVILPLLHHYGIRRVDLLIITHRHLDHYGAASALIEAGVIERICWPQADGDRTRPAQSEEAGEDDLTELRQLADQANCIDFEWPAGCIVSLGRKACMTKLWPVEGSYVSGNGASQVMYVRQGEADLLLMADLEQSDETSLIHAYGLPDVDVLRVGHHGSSSSTSRLLLQNTRPEIAIISVGRNSYGHPHAAVIESLHEAGSAVFRTDRDGAQRLIAVGGIWYRLCRPGQED